MNDPSEAIDELVGHLARLPAGPVGDRSTLVNLLIHAWHDLGAESEERTDAYKLERIENARWQPPELRFEIERHGATVMGSTRADLHQWVVNVDTREATLVGTGQRQLEPMSKPLDTKALAMEITALIISRSDDDRLAWSPDRTKVQIKIGRVIPQDVKETTANRRKRFTVATKALLAEEGWHPAGGRPHSYELRPTT